MHQDTIGVTADARDIYAPPIAAVAEPPTVVRGMEFYTVAPTKFFTLFLLTSGLYQLYWFYRQWTQYRRFHRTKMLPAARAIFAIFFTHSLLSEVDHRLKRNGQPHAWHPVLLATTFVLLQILVQITGRISSYTDAYPWLDVVSIAGLPLVALLMWRMQVAINLACGDPGGRGNARFTWANGIWIALGALFWLLLIAAIVLSGSGHVVEQITLPST